MRSVVGKKCQVNQEVEWNNIPLLTFLFFNTCQKPNVKWMVTIYFAIQGFSRFHFLLAWREKARPTPPSILLAPRRPIQNPTGIGCTPDLASTKPASFRTSVIPGIAGPPFLNLNFHSFWVHLLKKFTTCHSWYFYYWWRVVFWKC